ncbi:MAG: hypothetical protein HRT71_08130 [Flavobacteriales bacterium]|nr:hypothetical protein [Flavobacteriales bacterium]
MKRTIIITSILTILAFYSNAQETTKKVDILWGAEEKASRRSTLAGLIGHDKTGIYVLKKQRKGLYGMGSIATIEHYDTKLKKTKSVVLDLEYKGKDREYEGSFHLNENLYIYSSFRNQRLKINFLFVQTLNKETLQLNNDIQKIAEINYENKNKLNAGRFSFKISRDSTKVLVHYHMPHDKGAKEKLGFHVYDNEMKPIWNKVVTLPYLEELFNTMDYEISNTGDIYVLGRIYKEKQKLFFYGKRNFNYHILSYSNTGSVVREYPVKIEGKFLTDMQIAINRDRDIICAGFYSDEGTTSINGSYFLKIGGVSKEIMAKNFKEFGMDFITQTMTEKQKKKTNKKVDKGKSVEMYEYDLNNIILKDDGGAMLIGQQFYIKVHTTTSTVNGQTTTTTTYYYYFNDIIVINFSAAGEVLWTEKIAKRQVTTNDGGFWSSYVLSVVGDKLFFVFNDNPKNLFLKPGDRVESFRRGKGSIAVLVELDNEGNQTREALYRASEAGILARPMVCTQISKNEMILFGQKKKIHRFSKITFK